MLGGVASLDGEPDSPRGDFQIAAVGPAVSLLLAIVFGTAALTAQGASALVHATLAWLSGINAVLAVFNLIPAAPLDGGRIFRAALWRFRGDRRAAAVAATRAGEALGYLLVGFGLVRLQTGAAGGSIWYMLLGWFILNAARAERSQVDVRDALAHLRVRDVMTPAPVTAPDDSPPGLAGVGASGRRSRRRPWPQKNADHAYALPQSVQHGPKQEVVAPGAGGSSAAGRLGGRRARHRR